MTVRLGLEVHAAQITVCRQVDGRLPQPAQQLGWPELIALVKDLRASGATVFSGYEAGPCGYGLHRQLTALGVTNYVVAPQCWDERHRRVKTDKRDAREPCNRLERYTRGNTDAFSLVRVPTPEQERQRALTRQRGAVLKERRRCLVRGFGLMLAQGIHAAEGWWQAKVWPGFSMEVPAGLRPHVAWWQGQAMKLSGELDALTGQVETLSEGRQIPKGVGALRSAILQTEILDWGRFSNRREVGSYTGLCPRSSARAKAASRAV